MELTFLKKIICNDLLQLQGKEVQTREGSARDIIYIYASRGRRRLVDPKYLKLLFKA